MPKKDKKINIYFPNEYPLIIAALEFKSALTCSNSVNRTINKALKLVLKTCAVISIFETFLCCCFLFTSSENGMTSACENFNRELSEKTFPA